MPILSTDILFKLSTTAGAAGNANAQANPNNSLGKYISTTQIVDNTADNLFNDITGDQNAASAVDYRCFFVHNNNGSLTLQSPIAWLSVVGSGATIAIGLDTNVASAIGSSSAQALTIANTSTAPAGVTFSSPITKSSGISLGNLAAGQVVAIWVRRTATNSGAINSDGVTIRVEGDTSA